MNRPIIQKQPRYENRRLLDIAHEAPCFLNFRDYCLHPITGCEPCHANWWKFGRGAFYKSHDCFHVPGCRGVEVEGCHYALDYGGDIGRDAKIMAFERGLDRYIRWLLAQRRIVLDVPMAEMTMILDGNREIYLKAWLDGRARVNR